MTVDYAATLDPTPAKEIEVTPRMVTAGMKAFFRIADAWGVTNPQARVLLGCPSRSTLFAWKKQNVKTVPYDTVCRVSYVLGIYKALHILFKNSEQADGWVSRPNRAFGDKSALSHMLGGHIIDLASVRNYLDTVRGQGA